MYVLIKLLTGVAGCFCKSTDTDTSCTFRWFRTSRLCHTLHYTRLGVRWKRLTLSFFCQSSYFRFTLITSRQRSAFQLSSSSSSALKSSPHTYHGRLHFLCQMFCFSKVRERLEAQTTLHFMSWKVKLSKMRWANLLVGYTLYTTAISASCSMLQRPLIGAGVRPPHAPLRAC